MTAKANAGAWIAVDDYQSDAKPNVWVFSSENAAMRKALTVLGGRVVHVPFGESPFDLLEAKGTASPRAEK